MKLSIIVPVYNVEKYLARCLDSLLVPGLEDYEIIAVNDGSTDSSGAILADYAARYPQRIKTVTTPNGGLGHARNTGLPLAGGDYVMFVDSDDSLRQGAVPEIMELLDGSFDILVFDFVSLNEEGRQLSRSYGCAKEGCFTLKEYPELLFDMPNACNKIWRRSLFTDTGIRFPDRLWFEDLATSPKLYLHCDRIRYVRRDWYLYLQRSGSITNNKAPERNLEMLTVIHSVLDHYRKSGCYEDYKPQLEYMAFYHELLTSSTRVNQIDPKSPVQDALLEDFLSLFPDYQKNKYVQNMPHKYKLLTDLIVHKRRKELHAVMKLNNIARRKHI